VKAKDNKLKPEDFYLDKHQIVFSRIHDLYAASKPVDELSVIEALTQHGQIEDAGGLKLIYIDPPFDVGADFSMDIEIPGGAVASVKTIVAEQK